MIRSFEPGEDWYWSYPDEDYYESGPELAPPQHHPMDQPVPLGGTVGSMPLSSVTITPLRPDLTCWPAAAGA